MDGGDDDDEKDDDDFFGERWHSLPPVCPMRALRRRYRLVRAVFFRGFPPENMRRVSRKKRRG